MTCLPKNAHYLFLAQICGCWLAACGVVGEEGHLLNGMFPMNTSLEAPGAIASVQNFGQSLMMSVGKPCTED